jgi:uncharacterized cupredoxin-like copper-binding protein
VSQVSTRFPIPAVLSAVLVVVAALVLAACGGESDQDLAFELTGSGKSAKFTGPESADSGKAEISFTNNGGGASDMQLIRVEGDRTPEEVVEGLGKAVQGKPFPDWFFAGGGTSTLRPGKSATVTQVLEPGTYYALSTAGSGPDPGSLASVEVSGDESDEELEADATVTASEYQFEADGLKAGENEIDFRNAGAQPHHLLISKLVGDATAEDVEKAFKSGGSKPPIEQKGGVATAVIEGGESQLVNFDLKPGRYAFYCFISDRQGGPPHALKGMVDEVEVE